VLKKNETSAQQRFTFLRLKIWLLRNCCGGLFSMILFIENPGAQEKQNLCSAEV
jgi:hypothetical protein